MAKHPYTVSYPGLPDKKGRLSIYPQITDGRCISVAIMGDKEGLSYLAQLAQYLAEFNVEAQNMPTGARAHLHLHPDMHLLEHSCEVEICRAEAKGTGECPSWFGDSATS